MGLRNLIDATPMDPFARLAKQVSDMFLELGRLKSVVRRDCLKAHGYELEYRLLPTPGLYLVNKIDGNANFGTATFLGP